MRSIASMMDPSLPVKADAQLQMLQMGDGSTKGGSCLILPRAEEMESSTSSDFFKPNRRPGARGNRKDILEGRA